MISTILDLNIGDNSYRNTTGFYFGKWFDEPFTVDVLNRIKYDNLTFELCSQEEDKKHRDYKFIGVDNKLYYVDSKAHSHNYVYKEGGKDVYGDLLPIGQYVLTSDTHYISFVHRGFINIFPLWILNKVIKPVFIKKDSRGQNNSKQDLYMYNCYDIINSNYNKHIEIPSDMMKCYDEAYILYAYYKEKISKMTSKKTGVDMIIANQLMREFGDKLKPIIEKFNNIYDELPEVDIDENLKDIMSLIS